MQAGILWAVTAGKSVMTGEGISWREPEAGFRFEPGEVTVSAAHQQEKLGALMRVYSA